MAAFFRHFGEPGYSIAGFQGHNQPTLFVWRLDRKQAGNGALGDVGSHIVDMARFLVGEFDEVCGMTRTFMKERPLPAPSAGGTLRNKGTRAVNIGMGKVSVDDSAAWLATFDNGAVGTFEAKRFATGRKYFNGFEIYGSKGSLCFNFEEMNRLRFLSLRDGAAHGGFRDILVTDACHPYIKAWWPPRHIIGYEHTFVNAVYDFLEALASKKPASPDMGDGLQAQAVLEAVEISARDKRWVRV